MDSPPSEAASSSVLDNFKWVRCAFCLTPFSLNNKFYVLSCWKVACISCAKKMRSRQVAGKVDCTHCGKTVNVCEIRDEMPANVREPFESHWKFGANIVKTYKKQQKLRDRAREMTVSNSKRLKEKASTYINEYKRTIEKTKNAYTFYRERLLEIMPKQRLQQLLALSEEELDQMDARQILGKNSRRNQSNSSSQMRPMFRCSTVYSKH